MSFSTAKLEHYAMKFARRYLDDHGFFEMFPPRIVRASGACENIDTLFEVAMDGQMDWFKPEGKSSHAYLAQTGQLYLEAFVPELNKTYCVGSSFRAEPKVDERHLTEFTLLEIEFVGNFDQLLRHIEGVIQAMVHGIISLPASEIKDSGLLDRVQKLSILPHKFKKISYDEAIAKLQELGETIHWGDDISSAHEKRLLTEIDNQPLFIVRYPDPIFKRDKEIEVEKFFNMIPDHENAGRVLSADLILPFGGESVGAAARVYQSAEMIDRLKNSKMFARLVEKGGSLDDFKWYINNLEEKGSLPHAGCGFGVARILQWLLGKNSIIDSVTFPSNRGHII